jgi:hypothetical protein
MSESLQDRLWPSWEVQVETQVRKKETEQQNLVKEEDTSASDWALTCCKGKFLCAVI